MDKYKRTPQKRKTFFLMGTKKEPTNFSVGSVEEDFIYYAVGNEAPVGMTLKSSTMNSAVRVGWI
jgi:hypothetical protein